MGAFIALSTFLFVTGLICYFSSAYFQQRSQIQSILNSYNVEEDFAYKHSPDSFLANITTPYESGTCPLRLVKQDWNEPLANNQSAFVSPCINPSSTPFSDLQNWPPCYALQVVLPDFSFRFDDVTQLPLRPSASFDVSFNGEALLSDTFMFLNATQIFPVTGQFCPASMVTPEDFCVNATLFDALFAFDQDMKVQYARLNPLLIHPRDISFLFRSKYTSIIMMDRNSPYFWLLCHNKDFTALPLTELCVCSAIATVILSLTFILPLIAWVRHSVMVRMEQSNPALCGSEFGGDNVL